MSMYLRDGPSRSNEALALEIQGGDSDAAALLLSQNEGYLTMLARRCCGPYSQHSLAEDLKQEGALALLDAARRYDPSVGTRLLTYAAPAIETAMRDCAAQQQNTEADLLSAIQEKLDVSAKVAGVDDGGMNVATLDPERVAAYRSMGWRLVGKLGGVFWVWRCDDPDAPELDTDPVVQGEGYRYLKRRMIFSTAACGLVWLALLGLLFFIVLNLSLRTLLRQGSWLTLTAAPLVAVSLLAVLGVQLWLDARNTWRLWRTLSAGVPLERPKPYRRQLRLGQLVYAATLVVYTLNLMISFQNMGGSPSGWDHAEDILDRQTGQAPAETVAVSLAELDNVEPSWFSAERKSLPIAPEMYDSRQYAPLPEYGQVRAETAYYRMLTEGLARALTAELTENRAGFYDNLPAIPLEPVEAPGLDGFWWAEEMSGAGNADQFAVLRRGAQVVALWYSGPTDLRTETGYLTALLDP